MLKAQIYTLKGVKSGELDLPKDIFGQTINMALLAQANRVYTDRNHIGLRNTKTRSEVARTTKKVYKQKGTGGARHGSRRANIFVGGGIIFGPRPIKRILELPKSLKKLALASAFSAKAKAGEIVAVKGLSSVSKTKDIAIFLTKLAKEVKSKKYTFMLASDQSFRFLRNIKDVKAVNYKNANAFDVITAGQIVLDEAIFEAEKIAKVKTNKPAKKTLPKVVKK